MKPQLMDEQIERMRKDNGHVVIGWYKDDNGDVCNIRLSDAMDDIAAYKSQVEEMQKTLRALNDYVFANQEIPKSARSHMQRIIHYDLPKALQSLKEDKP